MSESKMQAFRFAGEGLLGSAEALKKDHAKEMQWARILNSNPLDLVA